MTEALPTIELSAKQAIHLVDSNWFEILGPSTSFEEIGDHSDSSESTFMTSSLAQKNDKSNILEVPLAAVELVEDHSSSNGDSDHSSYNTQQPVWAAPAPIEQPRRASLLSATVERKSTQEKLGLGLAMTPRGILLVSSIEPEGLLSKSPFRIGDRLVSINNVSCEHMPQSKAHQLLHDAMGILTVVAANDAGDSTLVESMVWKPFPDSKTGMAVVSDGYTRARVCHIRPNGLFERSLLSRKDLIRSVNNIPCRFLDSKEVADIVMRAKDRVTVVAERKFETAVVVATMGQ